MMRHRLLGLLLAGTAGADFALAQLPDPTRPPAAMMATEANTGAAVAVESGVQTVILRPGGKSAAVINGKYVQVGAMIGDKQVLKISENEVVLKGASGREVIKVTPAIEKLPAGKAVAAKRLTNGTKQQ